jgi:hypothetical protein
MSVFSKITVLACRTKAMDGIVILEPKRRPGRNDPINLVGTQKGKSV